MGLGLLILVSIGKENLYLSAQPEITYFKIAYKRHTNYSNEPIPQYFKTTPDFGRRCTVNIGKNADMMGMTYICVNLPSIQQQNFTNVNKQFAWVEKIGLALINFVEIEIGGIIIERHYGDWLNIWNELTLSSGLQTSYNKMIGNTIDNTGYSQQKLSNLLYIPLSFWFCQDSGLAIPLIALTHNDIKIHVEFNDIDLCYNTTPSYYINVTNTFCLLQPGEYFYQKYQNNITIGQFVYFDSINLVIYYNIIKGKFLVPAVQDDINYVLTGSVTNFKINIVANYIIVQDSSYFQFNPPSLLSAYLLVNYIFLDNFERSNFHNNSHEYLIPIVQTLPEQIIYSINSSYKLPLINPVKLIVWRLVLLANKNYNNSFNYTTFPYTTDVQNLINKNLLVINSVNRIDLSDTEYYTLIPKYQYNFINKQKGIYMYSFSLNPKDLQPSGSMNFSKIDDAYIQLTLNNIVNYQNPVSMRTYAIEYNLFRIIHGIGGIVFNN